MGSKTASGTGSIGGGGAGAGDGGLEEIGVASMGARGRARVRVGGERWLPLLRLCVGPAWFFVSWFLEFGRNPVRFGCPFMWRWWGLVGIFLIDLEVFESLDLRWLLFVVFALKRVDFISTIMIVDTISWNTIKSV
jgi:hypothetical protein